MKDIYWAEQHLTESLPELSEAVTSEQVKEAFSKHAKETEQHISMVEQVFRILGEEAKTKKCEAMEGLLKEAKTIIKDTEVDTFTRDAGLILAAQKVEHYEIATYGTLRIFAGYMGEDEIVEILTKILDNEKYTDVSLTKVVESFVNEKASEE